MHRRITVARCNANAGDQHAASEQPAGKMARQVERDAASRATAEAKDNANHRITLRGIGAGCKALQRG